MDEIKNTSRMNVLFFKILPLNARYMMSYDNTLKRMFILLYKIDYIID